MDLAPPIFMMGCERSGTTLLSRVMDSHSRLSIYFESYYYSIFMRELPYYGDLKRSSNLNVFLSDFLELTRLQGIYTPSLEELKGGLSEPSFECVFSAYLHLFALKNGKFRGGEKTPSNFYFIGEILERHPQSPVLFIIRDPRDAILSIRKAFDTTIAGAINQWNDAFNKFCQHRDQVHLVRYEDLVQQPTATLSQICDFINEPYEQESFLNFFEKIEGKLHGHDLHSNLVKPLNTSSIGKFKAMPESEIEMIEEACREGMDLLGYEASLPARRRGFNQGGSQDSNQASNQASIEKTATNKVGKACTGIVNVADRLRYYAMKPKRLKKGSFRWRVAARTRARYWLTLKPLWDKV